MLSHMKCEISNIGWFLYLQKWNLKKKKILG